MKALASALAVALGAALAGCNRGEAQTPPAGQAAPPAVPVSVLQVALREVPVVYEAVGRTEGSREVQVRARVSGILEQQLYTEGDTVKEGAPLFRIERAPFEIDLEQQRGALAQELARNELAKRDYERSKDLIAKGFVSQQYADQAAATLAQSNAAVQVARARVRQSELNLSYTNVAAPIAGITGRAQQSIGSLVIPVVEASLLTTITRTDPIWVRFALSEVDFAGLRNREAKQRPQVDMETADGTPFPAKGRLNFAGSTVDASLGTVQMRAEFPNPGLRVLPGQYVRVQVIAGNRQAIVVPQSAVLQNESGRFVWAVGPENKATQRTIRTGNWVGSGWVVLEGLKPGESVIVDNLARLRPGTPVQAAKKDG
ncbi:MAG TPA: efflux RND transporter periplasmic adaptor subunit [Burkholderiales bacterium]|nr:efflux RND transporter periplasmic adaptor subunit [Burkholderiales bacterium]